jgi:RES domain-containing protein
VILWRISDHTTLDGGGGLNLSGRWHSAGRHIVYCAPNPATALLEVLVHSEIDIADVPLNFRYLEIDAPDGLAVEDLDTSVMAKSWRTDLLATRQAGDRWLQSSRTALLRVPSVIVPATWNVLINPRHPDSAQIRVLDTFSHGLDPRLLR